jgi:hypothetical protein
MTRPPSRAEDDTPTQLRVRPYLLTAGRTRGDVDLPLEALLSTTEQGEHSIDQLILEPRDILRLCRTAISVAELAARLELPIQVTRVLVSDLINDEMVRISTGPDHSTDRPDLSLLERVLDGLQHL